MFEVVCPFECRMQTGSSRLRVPLPRTVSILAANYVVAIEVCDTTCYLQEWWSAALLFYDRPKMGAVVETFWHKHQPLILGMSSCIIIMIIMSSCIISSNLLLELVPSAEWRSIFVRVSYRILVVLEQHFSSWLTRIRRHGKKERRD